MLRVWENEFHVLLDLSVWEVSPTTFKLVPNKALYRNLKGRPQSSRIHNEMDIREKSDEKMCGVYKLASHNQRVEYCGGYGPKRVEYCSGYELGEVEYCGGYGSRGVEY
ncbi:hypothetical protein PVK06_026981 [Gossypium arboreum]|uniref:Uncharacterized protein n=1 Tax=Gossypium arboreum TaxID=29729 RepID=A0ABR0P224_GOSAR|nr:hypothetical protein PVK06_026981 [Gossypium arboreum]